MKIVAFSVWCECEDCGGTGKRQRGEREYKEDVPCPTCEGKGRILGLSDYKDFETLVHGVVAAAVKEATKKKYVTVKRIAGTCAIHPTGGFGCRNCNRQITEIVEE